jgi:osmotically-inducible protein OsmY
MKKHIRPSFLLVFMVPWIAISSCKESDSKIQAAVDTELKNSNMTGVSASVKNGVVTLTGECADETSKSSCESVVGKVKGVKQVIDKCTVPPPPAPAPVVISADETLKSGVTDAIKDYPAVKASVNDGVITLTGDINRANLQKLMMTLHTLQPKKIENKLTIK